MTWWVQAKQIADASGTGTGRWRLTATSDEDGGGPWGDDSHDHASADEAQACRACRVFMGMVTGFPLADQKPNDPEAEIAALRKQLDAWSEREALCCPEGESFEEVLIALRAKVEELEADNLAERERYADMMKRVIEAAGVEPAIGLGAIQAVGALRAKVEAWGRENANLTTVLTEAREERARYSDRVTSMISTLETDRAELCAQVTRLEGEASTRIGPGSPVARWLWLMGELGRLLGGPKPYSSHPPEARYVARIERLISVANTARKYHRAKDEDAAEEAEHEMGEALSALDAEKEEKCK